MMEAVLGTNHIPPPSPDSWAPYPLSLSAPASALGGPAQWRPRLSRSSACGRGIAWKLLTESLTPQALLFTLRELAACAIFTSLCCYFFCIISLSKRFTHLLKCHLRRKPPTRHLV